MTVMKCLLASTLVLAACAATNERQRAPAAPDGDVPAVPAPASHSIAGFGGRLRARVEAAGAVLRERTRADGTEIADLELPIAGARMASCTLLPFRADVHQLVRAMKKLMAKEPTTSLRNLTLTVEGIRPVLSFEIVSPGSQRAGQTAWAISASGSLLCQGTGPDPALLQSTFANVIRTATDFAPQPAHVEIWVSEDEGPGIHLWERSVFATADGTDERLAAVHASLSEGKLHLLECAERVELDASDEVVEANHRARGDIEAEDADTTVERGSDHRLRLKVVVGENKLIDQPLAPPRPLTTLLTRAQALRQLSREGGAPVFWSELGGFAGEGQGFMVRNRRAERSQGGSVTIVSNDDPVHAERCTVGDVGTCVRVQLEAGAVPRALRRVYVTPPR